MNIQTKTHHIISLSDIIELIGDDCISIIENRWTFGECSSSLVDAPSFICEFSWVEQDILWNAIKEQLKIEGELLPCDVENLFVDLEA